MKIGIISGAPAAGKGTACKLIVNSLQEAGYSVEHVSTGDILRDEVKRETELGLECKTLMDQGALVPDHLINKMVSNKLLTSGDLDFILLDGYPRSLAQAENLIATGLKGMTVFIDAPIETILERSSKRVTCEVCGTTTTADHDCCPKCGGKSLVRRADEDKIVERYNTFKDQTLPAIAPLYKMGPVLTVNGAQEVKEHVPLIMLLLENL